tara:strand:- start:7272 stop:7730 length:459 start_codon:yes stop_codon:yes gene_type:complete
MSIYKATSWGRTRRPKQMVEDVPSSRQAATSVTPVAAAALSNTLAGTNAGENGYITENQRFLHLQIENDDTDDTVTVYGYNYAFGSWAVLYIPVGVKSGSDTTAELAYVEAKFTTINGKKMVTIPLRGVDRVAFVHDGGLGDMVLRAAMSTF